MKKVLIGIAGLAVLAGAAFGIYKIPTQLMDVSAKDVAKIEIYGNNEATITSKKGIETIMNELTKTKYQRGSLSGEGGRQQYFVKLLDKNDEMIEMISIADSHTIDLGKINYHPTKTGINLNVFETAG